MKIKPWGYLLFILLALIILFYPLSILEIKNEKTAQIILWSRTAPGDQFEFIYTHSVDKTPVLGVFLITSKRTIKPIETHFLSYGTGLPSVEGKIDEGEGTLIAKPEVDELKQFSFFVSPFTEQLLIFKRHRIDFSSMNEGDIITISVTRYPIGKILFKYGS
jgi:hypothetical protein